MALAGITTVGEFHYLHHRPGGRPYDDTNAMGLALAEAAAEAGVRLTLLDTCYLHGGVGRDPDEVQRRFSDGDARSAWAARRRRGGSSATVRIGAAIHSVRAVAPDEMAVVASGRARRLAVCTPTSASSRRRTRPAWPPTAGRRRASWPARGWSDRASRPCTPPT